MGRKRTIDREATMAAIETVVRRVGVDGLSIDAVAREAGISKSSVVYGFQNKAGLLAAFTRSRLDARARQIADLQPAGPVPNRWLSGFLRATEIAPADMDTAPAMAVSAAMSAKAECHAIMRTEITTTFARVRAEATNPRASILATLALHGLNSLEFFGFYRFAPEERDAILRDLAGLIETPPGEPASPPPTAGCGPSPAAKFDPDI